MRELRIGMRGVSATGRIQSIARFGGRLTVSRLDVLRHTSYIINLFLERVHL